MLNARVLLYSLLVHVLVLGIMVFSFELSPDPLARKTPRHEVIQAVSVNEADVQAEIERLKAAESERERALQDKVRKLEREARKAEEKRKREEQRVADARKKQEREAKKRAAEAERLKKLQQERKAEVRRLAALKAQQEAAAKAKAEQEAQARAEAERAARARKEAAEAEVKRAEEQKRLAEVEARKKAAAEAERKREQAEQRRKAAEAALQAELDAERQRLIGQKNLQLERLMGEYRGMIQAKVERNWIKQPVFKDEWECTLRVTQLPTGDVTDVQAVRCDGTGAFQSSVVKAVYRASPLPKPPRADLYERVLEFNFKTEQ
ncbi:MAG: cell envelope integrity protein TolA [Gammaproteobacteria bacterium]